MNGKKREQQNNFHHGYQKANALRKNPAPLFYESQTSKKKPAIRNTEKHEGGIFIVFCHIMAHISPQFDDSMFSFTLHLSHGWLFVDFFPKMW